MNIFRDYDGDFDYTMFFLIGGLILAILFLTLVVIPYIVIDSHFIKPIADDRANDYCKSFGFDQYKDFSRVGLWSKNPIGIKCEYAEKYTDLGVRVN